MSLIFHILFWAIGNHGKPFELTTKISVHFASRYIRKVKVNLAMTLRWFFFKSIFIIYVCELIGSVQKLAKQL